LQFSKIYSLGRKQIDGCENMPFVDLSTDWNTGRLPKKIDVVIHLAQSPKYKDFPDSALDVFNTNLKTTAILLDYAKSAGAKRFILASTGGIYKTNNDPISEDSELIGPSDLSYYFATKLSSEMIAANYRTLMDVNILRIFFMYGSNQRKDAFIPSLMSKINSDQVIFLSGQNGISVNPVHVGDVADAIANLVKLGGPKTINAAGSEILTIRNICEIMGTYIGKKPIFQINPALPNLIAENNSFQALVNHSLKRFELEFPEILKTF
jgi:nucleoside-diphosphate-sugar epimerase